MFVDYSTHVALWWKNNISLACLCAEGCLESCLAAGSILSGTETLHCVVGAIINGCKESAVQQ